MAVEHSFSKQKQLV